MYGGSDGGSGQELLQEQQAKELRVRQGSEDVNDVFNAFGPDFYKGREQAYVNYATPFLGKEANRMRKQTAFGLARGGLLNSNAGDVMRQDLTDTIGQRRREIADEGIRQSNELRGNIEQSRGNILQNLFLSGDPSSATQAAMASASNFRRPSAFTPVSGMLNDWANIYLANKTADIYRNAMPQTPQYQQPLMFGPSKNASTIVK